MKSKYYSDGKIDWVKLIRGNIYFRIVWITIAILLIVIQSYNYISGVINSKNKEECVAVTTGEVYTYPAFGKNSYPYVGRVGASYSVDGVSYRVKGKDSKIYYPGDHIDVHYNPSNPRNAYAGEEPYHILLLDLLLSILFGLGMIIIAIIISRKQRRG